MKEPLSDKATRKVSAAAAEKSGAYEDTAFGRRRVSRFPRWMQAIITRLVAAAKYVFRRVRRRDDAG